MSDSEQQGFHQPKTQTFIVKMKNVASSRPLSLPNNYAFIFRSALSLHYELPLYQYPKQLDAFSQVTNHHLTRPLSSHYELLNAKLQQPLLLSQFFPRKLNCVYNRFHQNLLLKRDMTILIRNIASRIQNDQLATFHDRPRQYNYNSPLSFTSNFEGGNLHCVYKEKRSCRYYLMLQNDINTHGYNIWFHFNIRASFANTYQFIIVNLAKQVKFKTEIALLTYSSKTRMYERRVGFNLAESKFRHNEMTKYWTLHFQYTFQEGEDVYFSITPPYTYTKLLKLLKSVSQPFYLNTILSIENVCKSELGNSLPLIKIQNKQKSARKCVFITARQHPCETVGSFVCENIIKMLTSESGLAQQLLNRFDFYIIPMVNPDGVIHGNARTNLLGYDINRNWNMQSPTRTAESQQIWNYICSVAHSEHQISWCFDLHGHSKQLGFFSYFCKETEDTLLINHFLSQNSHYYQHTKSVFGLGGKRQSIRGQLYEQLHICKAVTIQTSYYGYRNGEGQLIQYDDSSFTIIAACLLKSLLQTQQTMQNKAAKKKVMQELARNAHGRSMSHKQNDLDSDSNPEQDYLLYSQRVRQKLIPIAALKNIDVPQSRRIISDNYLQMTNQNFYSKTNYKSNHHSESKSNTPFAKQIAFRRQKTKDSVPKLKSRTEKDLSLTFYAGRRTVSPKQKERERRKQQIKLSSHYSESKYPISSGHDIQEQDQILKNSLAAKALKTAGTNRPRRQLQQTGMANSGRGQNMQQMQVIVYPTAANAGLQLLRASLKDKKDIIKQIRNKELIPFSFCGKLFNNNKLKTNPQ